MGHLIGKDIHPVRSDGEKSGNNISKRLISQDMATSNGVYRRLGQKIDDLPTRPNSSVIY